nr:CAunnamed protein product [Biomphalaria glabrata]
MNLLFKPWTISYVSYNRSYSKIIQISQRDYSDTVDYSCKNKTFLSPFDKSVHKNLGSENYNSSEKVLPAQKITSTFASHNEKNHPTILLDDPQEMTALSMEKKILSYLVQNWELEKASETLKTFLSHGTVPDRQIVFDMFEHLAFLGQVDNLLNLNEHLKEHSLISNLDFLRCLHYAYCNSGRISDGVEMIRHLFDCVCHGTQKELDADIFFNLLTTKIILHFPHRLKLIQNFINEMETKHPNLKASLWCCYVQAEQFAQADEMLKKYAPLKKLIPAQVTKLAQYYGSLDFNVDSVLMWILRQTYIKPGLKSSVFDVLLIYTCKMQDWNKVFHYLLYARKEQIKLHQQTLDFFLNEFLNEFSERTIKDLSHWSDWTRDGY